MPQEQNNSCILTDHQSDESITISCTVAEVQQILRNVMK